MTRLGYQIPSFTYPDTGPAELFDVIARQAKEADTSGFDTVLVMDHFYQLPHLGEPERYMLECYTLLAALARETANVRLSALVTGNTYRNPAVLAKTVTTLDIISNGRAQLGIGAGWFELEHDAFGIEFGTFTDRFEKLEEALQIILPMLNGEKATLAGKHYNVVDAMNSPAPVRHVPVMIGGGGERKTFRMAAQYADEANIIADAADMPRKLEALAQRCAELGRDRSTLVVSWQRTVCIAPTMEEARADLDAYIRLRGMDPDTLSAEWRAIIAGRFLIGDPDTVGEQLTKELALGIDGFTINLPANGHVPGRVTLLGETAAKVVG
ncbi:MAG: putative oxidoreductase [Ilumatobacteraceae bacterium]|nr:putative oxidoreductase [Ilumatobacteraceae bacterium]MCU1391427.1 putative oxidoreductase [Ilumatobacteraceae bacterium]